MSQNKDIEQSYWFTNKQVISIVGFVAISVFYGTMTYMNFLQLRTEHDADMQHIEDVHVSDLSQAIKDMEVLENRLDKKIKIQNDIKNRLYKIETYIALEDLK